MKKFYMTLGLGQRHFPGYFVVKTDDEHQARLATSKALNRCWCGTYEELEDVHPADRIYRGEITLASEIIFGEEE
jgi:hypothetical protein